MQKVVAEIHLGNIRRNAQLFKEISGAKLCAVVKSNAYGHGALKLARFYEKIGADYFAVSNIEEALELRGGG